MEDQEVNSIVLLIDEYDAVLTACLNDSSLFNRVRNYLAHFYSLIKAGEGIFRFVVITGITRFNKISIFSEMNNFSDISLEIKYGSLLGYTEQEVKKYFGAYLSNAARVLDSDPEILFAKLKKYYDGFCFERSVK